MTAVLPQFLYVLRYPAPGWKTLAPLARAEVVSLTGGRPVDDHVVLSPHRVAIAHAVYAFLGMEVLCAGETFKEALDQIRQAGLEYEQFRIDVFKFTEKAPPSPDMARRAADCLSGYPNLNHPAVRLALVVTKKYVWFGRVFSRREGNWDRTRPRGQGYCQALSVQMARALVNLVARTGERFLDPCCGSGTVLVEAGKVGLKVEGSDVNARMVLVARKYAELNGVQASVECRDARELEGRWDVLATNLPYGLMGKDQPFADAEAIAANVMNLAPRLVLIASSPLRSVDAREIIELPTSRRLVRYVHLVGEPPPPAGPPKECLSSVRR